jgi:hypothetical protein
LAPDLAHNFGFPLFSLQRWDFDNSTEIIQLNTDTVRAMPQTRNSYVFLMDSFLDSTMSIGPSVLW